MKTLIIAEKPDMGRNIAAAIDPKAKNFRTYIEGEQYIITWAIGHLIGLAEPDAYDDKYKKWNFNDLPIIPDHFKLIPNARTKDQLKQIGELAKRSEKLVNACDAGREGQHIFSLIQRHLKLKQPVKRLWISDLTPETIRKGFAELREGVEYENLTKAARVRSEADWLIGMNGSRAFTTKHQVLLSVGRVQTPVLAILYDRQKEIEAFSSNKFYDVEALFKQQETEYKALWQGERITDPAKANAIVEKVKGKMGVIASYEVKDTKEYPFKLYDLTLLQREANAKLGFSAKKTLDTAQALYEKHKVISYPRTNSNYVTEANIPEMYKALDQLKGTSYGELAEQADKRLVHKNNKSICNPTKVEDHHAILPTHKKAGGLSNDEQQVYDLIVRRFLAQFYPPAEYKIHTVLTEVEREMFKSTIKQLLSLGWKVIYADQKKGKPMSRGKADKTDEDEVPEEEITTPFSLQAAEAVKCAKIAAKEKETQPPKAYTEGTLLKAMEGAGKQIEDEELRDAMKDSGLGTPATRASVIERLKQVDYIVMQGKRIIITQKGRTAVELIRSAGVDLLTSPEMTGHWERRLNEIARGVASDEAFMANVKKFTNLIIEKVRVQSKAAKQAFESAAGPASAGAKRTTRTRSSEGGAEASGSAGAAGGAKRTTRTRSSDGGAEASGSAGAAGGAKRTTRTRSSDGVAEASGSAGAAGGAKRTTRTRSSDGVTEASGSAGAAGGAKRTTRTRSSDGGAEASGSIATGAQRLAERARFRTAASEPALPSAAQAAMARGSIAACPRSGCAGRIIAGKRGYGCTAYKAGCGFVLWKDSLGASLSETDVRSLIERGHTAPIRRIDENGNQTEDRLYLSDTNTGQLALEPSITINRR
ncbi:type IA DNA topoisomerase [Paenibacillus sp. FSL H7-0331]|uniref:type IA DNA topoisomerase n=1 Tax=Paenibacillus sp. FSL H7-0331 TaxID=1920421 RepID=UPI00096EF857|nr:type IA DNA topoisomerase [Paenibacillus sp. FSL H7-0331]OMF19975.1 DNA topoisomerase III [Paenibacillus sp. FSL H7-0331]